MLDHSERIMSYHDYDDAGFISGLVLNADDGYAIGMQTKQSLPQLHTKQDGGVIKPPLCTCAKGGLYCFEIQCICIQPTDRG